MSSTEILDELNERVSLQADTIKQQHDRLSQQSRLLTACRAHNTRLLAVLTEISRLEESNAGTPRRALDLARRALSPTAPAAVGAASGSGR
jgi:uncharacterized coiled-coil protein SlyX